MLAGMNDLDIKRLSKCLIRIFKLRYFNKFGRVPTTINILLFMSAKLAYSYTLKTTFRFQQITFLIARHLIILLSGGDCIFLFRLHLSDLNWRNI